MQRSKRLEIGRCARQRLLERIDLRGGQVPRAFVERAPFLLLRQFFGDRRIRLQCRRDVLLAARDHNQNRCHARCKHDSFPYARDLAGSVAAQYTIDPSFQPARALGADPLPRDARAACAHGVGDVDKHAGVHPPISRGIHGRFVCGVLGRRANVRSSHHASGWNQKTQRFTCAMNATSGSRRWMCASSCATHARNFSAGHSVQPVGRMMVGARTPAVTGVATSGDSRTGASQQNATGLARRVRRATAHHPSDQPQQENHGADRIHRDHERPQRPWCFRSDNGTLRARPVEPPVQKTLS